LSRKSKYALSLAVVVIIAALSIYGVFAKPPGLGLDLKGGLNVVLTAEGNKESPITQKGMDQAIFIIRERVDRLGVAEPSIEQQGPKNIIIQLPGIKNPEQAIKVIGQTALLEFALVDDKYKDKTELQLNLDKSQGKPVLGKTLLTGKSIEKASASFGSGQDQLQSEPEVDFTLNPTATTQFADITSKNTDKRLAIVLDDKIITAPTIQTPITDGSGRITGIGSIEEAKRLALVLQTGNLPFKMTFSQTQNVGPTLGRDSLIAGLYAGIIGFALVALFMLGFYRVFGLITWFSLAIFGCLLAGFLVLLNIILSSLGSAGIGLSLPSIAGIILMIGVAADSSIIVFERIKEEVRAGINIRTALDTGYKHGLQTFLDADLVTFVTAAVLFWVGVGPVKGFAITLMLGIVADITTSLLFTRSILGLMASYNLIKSPALIGLKKGNQNA